MEHVVEFETGKSFLECSCIDGLRGSTESFWMHPHPLAILWLTWFSKKSGKVFDHFEIILGDEWLIFRYEFVNFRCDIVKYLLLLDLVPKRYYFRNCGPIHVCWSQKMDKSERANTILKGYSGTQDDKLGLQEQMDQVIFFSFFFFFWNGLLVNFGRQRSRFR